MNQWTRPSGLDRNSALRAEERVAEEWGAAAVLQIDPSGNLAAEDGRPSLLPDPGERQPEDILLGWFDGRPWFVRPVATLSTGALGWRDIDPADSDPLAAAVALTRWHATTPVCEACGSRTVPDLLGARRVCPECGALSFPRIDPCIIVAITDPEDRLLLARQGQWESRRFSVVAGFIEAGESAEQAVHREVAEEVGVSLIDLSYVSSQPWPMPRSLMLGFEARAEDARIRVDGDEIVEGEYYTRSALAAAVDVGSVILPTRTSIARHLIERWLTAG